MLWYFEPIQAAPRSQRAIQADQKRVMRVTVRDNAYLQRLAATDWSTPADDVISMSGRNSPRKVTTRQGMGWTLIHLIGLGIMERVANDVTQSNLILTSGMCSSDLPTALAPGQA